jgi:Flp pilus assembly pilin Flp
MTPSNRLVSLARTFTRDDTGAALMEYAVLLLVIAALVVVAINTIGSKLSNGFNSVNTNLP